MLIHEAKKDRRPTREMKVQLPIELHLRLHSAKVFYGERICDVVTRALEAYFQQNPPAHAAAPEPAEA